MQKKSKQFLLILQSHCVLILVLYFFLIYGNCGAFLRRSRQMKSHVHSEIWKKLRVPNPNCGKKVLALTKNIYLL